jgi:TetR/AcrR family transcriptional regulator, regulator of biofilm formation and stress response
MAYISNDDRREQLIAAAAKVIREQGLVKATTRRIADTADAPLGSLHYSFRSKEELYEAVMQTIGDVGRSFVSNSVEPEMGHVAAAAAMLRASARWVGDAPDGDLLSELEFYIWAVRSGTHADFPQKNYGIWLDMIERLFETAKGPDEPVRDCLAMARMLLAFIDGYNIQDQFYERNSMPSAVETAAAVMARGIGAGDFDLGASRNGKRRARSSERKEDSSAT